MIDALYRDHADTVYSRVLFQTGRADVAEEITQSAFERIIRQDATTSIDNLAARLNAITEGLVLDYYRAAGRAVVAPAGSATDVAKLAHARPLTFEQDYFDTEFDAAIRELPDPERDAFILTDLRGLTVREAASVLGTSKSDIARRADTARAYIGKEVS